MSFTKICIQGICTSSALAVVSKCPFGDDVVVNQQTIYNQLPTTQMSCPDVFDFISTTLKQFPLSYCADSRFKAVCCKTCSSYYNNYCNINKISY